MIGEVGVQAAAAETRRAFAAQAGFGDAVWTALPGDASPRRYFRLRRARAPSALLMDTPAGDEMESYIRVAGILRQSGLAAPDVLAADRRNGFLLIEDFGDATFTRLLAEGGSEMEGRLYPLAIDALAHLHRSDAAARFDGLRYDAEMLADEALLLPEWGFPVLLDRPCDPDATAAWGALWRGLVRQAPTTPDALVVRDFHVDNLMHRAGGAGVRACGLLDFQDAVIGPRAYDVVSILEDARRDLSDGRREALLARYVDAMGDAMEPIERFEHWAALLAAQRHAKVIGIFARLARRDGKSGYLCHIPRVVRLFTRRLAAHRVLAPVAEWVAVNAPDLSARAESAPGVSLSASEEQP